MSFPTTFAIALKSTVPAATSVFGVLSGSFEQEIIEIMDTNKII
jgi:hypothetical protein